MYCVYWTTYSGTLLPSFYIGSTKSINIKKGYCGSVRSCKWKKLWYSELRVNPHLFSVKIISTHQTREEALSAELKLQKQYNVIKNPNFVNEVFATVNGCFGRDVSGQNHPMFGKKHSAISRAKISANHYDVSGSNNPMFGKPPTKGFLGKHHTEETKAKMKANQWDRSGSNNPMFGKPHPDKGTKRTEETKQKMRGPKQIVSCPHCLKSGGKPAMIRFHFDNCPHRADIPSL